VWPVPQAVFKAQFASPSVVKAKLAQLPSKQSAQMTSVVADPSLAVVDARWTAEAQF
jgi:hypothetical protein